MSRSNFNTFIYGRQVNKGGKESYFQQMKGNCEEALHSGIMDCPVGQMSIEDFLSESLALNS